MQVSVVRGGFEGAPSDTLILPLFANPPDALAQELDARLDGAIGAALEDGLISARPHRVWPLLTLGKLPVRQLLLVGAGEASEWSRRRAQTVAGAAIRHLRRNSQPGATLALPGIGDGAAHLAAAVYGAYLANFSTARYRTTQTREIDVERLIVLAPSGDEAALSHTAENACALGEAANLARTLANEPGNLLTPSEFARRAQDVANTHGLECDVMDEAGMRERSYGALLGVASGSKEPARLVTLRYTGDPSGPTVGLVGKGVTFDTGGISIKPSENMHLMKLDMSGAAAVLGVMQAIARLRPRVNAIGVLCLAENMPGEAAIKPGDVLRAGNGMTIEVLNTDAEGRLVLADGLVHALSQGATYLVDVATLTGANRIALGGIGSGLYGSHEHWTHMALQAAEDTGEQMWHMPMYDELREQMNSDVADLANTGGREGGAIKAATFLREFTGGAPWVHLDIAGPSFHTTEKPWISKGPSGVAVATLVRLLESVAQDGVRDA